jgi:hypothetical protein
MSNYSEDQLNAIVAGFIDKSLDKSLWTHQAHIITAIWHVMKFDNEDALCRMRSGIISYNLATGGENTGQSGYHETITVFWCDVISRFLDQYPGYSFTESCRKFLSSPMADRNFPFRFYTKENLMSPVARSRFVKPDLKEINNSEFII